MKAWILPLIGPLLVSSTVNAQLKSGIDPKGFDKTVRVQDDLFLHVNGEWLKHTPIPSDKSNYGTIIELSDDSQSRLRAIVEEAAQQVNKKGSDAQRVGDFYRSYLNEEKIEQLGIKPLRSELAKLDKLTSKTDVVRHFGYLQTAGVGTPIGFFVDLDDKDSTRYLAALVQSGTTLPDRDYYLEDDPKYEKARQALLDYVTQLFELADLPDPAGAAKTVLDVETRLAKVQWERTRLRDAEQRYNKYAIGDLDKVTPTLPWKVFFAAADVDSLTDVNMMTPSFFQGLEAILAETPVSAWKQYLQFQVIDGYASALSKDFVDASFELHKKQLAGIPEQKPRWKRAVETTAGARGFGVLGDAVGKLYVKKHFTADAKSRMDVLVNNLLKTYQKSIDELTWMTPETKKRAQEKLAKITTKIGYTEKWRDYSRLEINDDLVGNLRRSAQVEYRRMVDKLGKSVDRTEWGMTPQTVNAYYNPGMNEIVFPAAILQPPFFDATVDDAVNYGSIGSVIGHEISHAFDDQGSKYDGDGNLQNWWTNEDREAFRKLTEQLVAQYAGYEPLPGKRINGQLTLGENIADLSGMSIAFKAYQLSLGGKKSPVIDSWTGEQRFFLGWSQVWRRKYRNAEMVRRLLTDPHAPSRYRANGPVMNLDAFYEAFDVKSGDELFKPAVERIRIW
ncbi:MAG TPA: M13-type metalloendopeptidase [Pirellulaceae bacterium]|nr:M13-type metalloendopeptidase [Pirellulaceae bacterium]